MAGSSSAPTERVLDIIESLARRGDRRMRFSDIARELVLTQGTAHAILSTLTSRGWVTRDPAEKTFGLGPALSLIAASLSTARPLARAAGEAARRLVEAIDMPASVVEVVGDELMITAFESPAHNPITSAITDRIPYRPPFGVAFAAWDTADAQREWIDRGSAGDAELDHKLRGVLSRTRDRGYDVDVMTPALQQAAQAIGTLAVDTLPTAMRPVIDRMRVDFLSAGLAVEQAAEGPLTVATISAPVLHSTGHTRLILGVHPLRLMTDREIKATAERLLTEAATVAAEA